MGGPNQDLDPPRLAEWLLERAIANPVARAGLTGDLRESFAERLHKNRRWVCALWYWSQVIPAVSRYLFARFARPNRAATQFDRRKNRMPNMIKDFQYALRMLVKSPGMAAMSIVALTLGIAMPTIMFTIINGVFEDLPIEQPHRVLRLYVTDVVRGGQRWNVSQHDYADWRAQQSTFEDLAGFATDDVTLSGGDSRPLRRNAAFVTTNMFNLLRVRPILGRSFVPDDVDPGVTPVVIVSHGVWQNRFGGASDVVGRVLTVDGMSHTVVGVMPQGFGFPGNEGLWIPQALALDVPRIDSHDLQVFGRLLDDVSLPQAQVELRGIAARLATQYPEANAGRSAGAVPFSESVIEPVFARGLYTMLGAVSFVLLIACVNVANLLLARALSRRKEIAVRCALGASRSRVISQLLIESLVITSIGGILGVFVAWLGVRLINQALTPLIGLAWVNIEVDGAVLMFVAGAVLLGSLLAGMFPALQASSVNISGSLKDSPPDDAKQGLHIGRLSKSLVAAEIALSCALLVISGLLIKGVLQLRAIDFGMPLDEIVTGEVELPRDVYTTPESRIRFFQDLEVAIGAIPGVRSAALMSDIPGTIGFQAPVIVDGQTFEEQGRVGVLTVTPSFIDVLGAEIIEGRGFNQQDRRGAELTIIVNGSFVDRFFSEQRPIGRHVELFATQYTVVGVVPDLFMGRTDEPGANGPGVYFPLAQSGNVSMQLMVRTWQDPTNVTVQIREVLESLDPNLAIMDVDRVDHLVARQTLAFDIFGRLFLVFGLVALFLASVGLYGVMAFSVRQRTREWGLRLALGATGRDVVKLATKQAVIQLLVGLSIGLFIAGALSRPLASFFYLVEPWDLTVFGAIVLLLTLTGVLAAFAPVFRATRVDPLDAMRHE